MDSSLIVDKVRKNTSPPYNEANNSFTSGVPQSPVLIRQYTVREIVTPTKTGYVTMKESSFSFSFSDKCPVSPLKQWTSDTTYEPKRLDSPQRHTNGSIEKLRRKEVPHPKRRKVESPHDRGMRTGMLRINGERTHISERQESLFQSKESHKLHWMYILFLPLLPLFAFTIVSFLLNPTLEKNIKLEQNLNFVYEALNKDVFGQEEAISSLLRTLESFINVREVKEKEMPVILLTGSNGVGKSLVASIITRNFPPPGEAELIILSPLPPGELIISKLSGSGPHLIVVDNLTTLSAADIMKWTKNLLNEAVWQQKLVSVILVFNVQVWNDGLTLQDHCAEDCYSRGTAVYSMFNSSGFTSHHIHFNVLTEKHVKNCIRIALNNRGLQNDPNADKYVEMISNQINYREEGCKPVWSQALLIDSNLI